MTVRALRIRLRRHTCRHACPIVPIRCARPLGMSWVSDLTVDEAIKVIRSDSNMQRARWKRSLEPQGP